MTSIAPSHSLAHACAALLLALLTVVGALLPAAPAYAQPADAADAFLADDAPDGVHILWRSSALATAQGASAAQAAADVQAQLPLVRYQGYDLPLQAVPVRLAGPEQLSALQIQRLESVDLPPGAVTPGDPDTPPVLDDEGALELAPAAEPVLPAAPLFVLRSGRVNGQFIAVLAVSPIYADGGAVRLVTELEAFLPGATRIVEAPAGFLAAGGESAAAIAAPEAVAPALAEASTAQFKLKVTAPGIQRVPLAALKAIAPGVAAADLAKVRLTAGGAVVAVQVAGEELRFFAPAAGDRWNTTSAYLLSFTEVAANRSPAMPARAVAQLSAAAAPSTVLERGEWSRNRVYKSLHPGTDGDHWFATDLSSEPGAFLVRSTNTLTATLWNDAALASAGTLPLAGGTSTFTVHLSPYRGGTSDAQPLFNLRVQTDGGAVLDFPNVDVSYRDANGRTRWYANYDHRFTTTATARTLTFSVLPAADFAGANVDSISFERPVTLDLGPKGALFAGNPGQTRYAWRNANPAGGLYDVTDPALPVVLTGANANGFTDAQPARGYLLAGESTLHLPAVEPFSPVSFSDMDADALYIVPDSTYAARLSPLVALRIQQGYKVEVVDVRRIYDAFSFGQVAPEGIRRFLQYAYARWSPRPISAVLVGDGTWDIKNYEGKDVAPALIPPYMHDGIDPWLGEAPCDNCYGQLHDRPDLPPGVYDDPALDNPHKGDDPNGRIFDMEVWIGRLPVKSLDELDVMVRKIVGYETAGDPEAFWRSQVLYYADNYLKPLPNGPNCTPVAGFRKDTAGDFARLADEIFALHPAAQSALLAQRVYYDPFPESQQPPAISQSWREPNTNRLGRRVLGAMNAGLAVSVYNGHANTWTMGSTERDAACTEPGSDQRYRPAILTLFDELELNNENRLFVQLSMTCLTSQFAAPADSGTTIDERLVLHPHGGAVAAWGPAGLSVVHGHDLLQKGFFETLFSAPGGAPRLGELLDGGYSRVLLNGYTVEDVLRTFHLLGDPLTRLGYNSNGAAQVQHQFLPLVGK